MQELSTSSATASSPSAGGPPPLVSGGRPVVGHALEFARARDELFRRGHREHGDVFTFRLGPKNAVAVTGADLNALFYRETDRALNMSKVYAFLKACFGEVLFTAGHETYLNQRPLLQQTFSRERMGRYVLAMHAEVTRWIDGLGEEGEVDLSAAMLRLTQHVAGHAFFGPGFRDELAPEFWDHYLAVSAALDPMLPPWLPIPRFVRRDRARRELKALLAPLIERRRQDPEGHPDLVTHLLTTPLVDGSLLDDEGIITFIMGMLFAGHETTAGQAAWTVIQLLQHPAYLDEVREEVDRVLADDEPTRGEVLRKLERVYHAIEETTRMRPSADIQLRQVETDLDVGPYRVPAGWMMVVNAANSHGRAGGFTDPERYDPHRFAPGRKEGGGYAMVSFGGGVHKCTGMNFAKNEMAIITALLFHRFDVELVSRDVHVVTGKGANHPSEARIRYRLRA